MVDQRRELASNGYMMTKFLVAVLLLLLGQSVLYSRSVNADINQTYTRTTKFCPIDISYSDLHAMLARISTFRDRANQGVISNYLDEDLTVENESTKTALRKDFSIGALSQGPELATTIRYAYRIDNVAPISEITLWLADASRTLTVSGTDRAQVDGLVFLVEQDVEHLGCAFGGSSTRFFSGAAMFIFSFLLATITPALPLTVRSKATLVITCLIMIFSLLIFPWEEWLPGTAIRASNLSFLARNSPLIGLAGTVLSLSSVIFFLFPYVLSKLSGESEDDKEK